MKFHAHNFHYQSGVVLVVSLIMLAMLTLLAITTMRGASLEVTMAGNAQFAENAFQLAETGKDSFLANAAANPDCIDTVNPGLCNIPETIVSEMNGSYAAQDTFINLTPNCPNLSSMGTFAAYHFEVQANGRSIEQVRQGGASQHTQGWWVCRNN
jgi:type IV pilus assembly protein PilX